MDDDEFEDDDDEFEDDDDEFEDDEFEDVSGCIVKGESGCVAPYPNYIKTPEKKRDLCCDKEGWWPHGSDTTEPAKNVFNLSNYNKNLKELDEHIKKKQIKDLQKKGSD